MSDFPDIPPHEGYKLTPDNVWITVGKFWAAVVAIIAATVWAVTQWWGVKQELREIRQMLETTNGERWKASHQREWAHSLRAENPTLKVPNPDITRTNIP